MLLPQINPPERRNKIKQLFACIELDGTFETWKYHNNLPKDLLLPKNNNGQTLISLPNGQHFPVQTYFRQQQQKTEHIALKFGHVTELISYWSSHYGGSPHPERTLKSEILCEWEAISRRAKILWAIENGHDVISLQHDGIVLALREGTRLDEVTKHLQDVSSKATSYNIPVTNKPMTLEGVRDNRPLVGAKNRPIDVSSYKI